MRRLIFKARFLWVVAVAMLVGVWPMAAQAVATAPSLGAAGSFAALGSSTVTCTGPSNIVGDVGVSPGSAITGFPPCKLTGAFHSADATSLQAQIDATTAYNDLKGATCDVNLTGQDLGTLLPLAPGVYCFDSSAELTGTLNLTGGGIYIFQIGSTLTTASGSSVLISNAQPCDASSDVFWQVGSSATLGTTTAFAGNILALASITMTTRATLDGRAIALNGAVTMDTNTISTCGQTGGGGNGRTHCNQGVGNGPEGCDPGNSNQGNPARSNDELGGTPGSPGRKGGKSQTASVANINHATAPAAKGNHATAAPFRGTSSRIGTVVAVTNHVG